MHPPVMNLVSSLAFSAEVGITDFFKIELKLMLAVADINDSCSAV